ncbi:MAG TPA: beta-ketoacyl synthase N-terminal-like domain-containing protein, partial [bacterium]|nr:beta-ketoacyl synthase N-terminal-like domain-containing protein [bacterium]
SADLIPAIEASVRADGTFDLVKFGREGLGMINPLWLLRGLSNNVLGFGSARLDAQGWNTNLSTSGAAGLMAIGDAAVAIASGRADVVIAGGYDANVSPEAIVRLARLGLTTTKNEDGARASRPFDARRDGIVPADGATFLVLEALDHAWARKADVLGEIAGYGATDDAWRLLDPDPAGGGITRAMRAAIHDAELAPDRVRAVFAHGVSNPRYDKAETAGIKGALGEHAKRIPVPAIKGALGHTIAASGAIAAAAAVFAVREGRVPPTLHLEERDPDCDLDHAAAGARRIEPGPVVVNASGLGGINASLVILPPERPGP